MLFTDPCNGAGGKRIKENVEMEVLDIVPSHNSQSLYARVEVRDLWSNKIIGVGYVSLRAAALCEALVHKHYKYTSAEGIQRANIKCETIEKVKEFHL